MVDFGLMILDFLVRLSSFVPLISFLFLLFVLFINSHLLYARFSIGNHLQAKAVSDDTHEYHDILIIVPAYNESKTIRQKIENLYSLNYPPDHFSIAVVDGASTDSTGQIALDLKEEKGKLEPKMYFIQQESRTGKSDGILQCLSQIDYGELVLVTDANCRLDPDSLSKAQREFRDSNVGGVTLRIQYSVSADSWVSESERSYWNLVNRQRIQISHKGLFFHFNGAFQMMRRNLTGRIFENSKYTFAEDMIGGIVTVLSGYKVIYLDNPSVVEPGITSVSDLIRQKTNRAVGLYDTIGVFRKTDSSLKKQYRTWFYLKTLVPLFSPLFLISLIILLALMLPIDIFIILFIGGLLLSAVVSKIRYSIVIQYAIGRALLSILTKRRGRFWEKTESDRFWPDSSNQEK